jgi:DNA (cytosine-5)-methyltransferase 1
MGEQLTVGSLFSGIGGLDLGLERAGMRVIWQSEIDDYASKVLKKHWPKVPNYGDIKTINWADVPPTDVICGGYPCQPFSLAGERQGEKDERHLWPWVRDAISHIRPRYVILENVQGHLSLGGTTVVREITELGYICEWRIIPATAVGAPHRRNRMFIVAYPAGKYGNGRGSSQRSGTSTQRETVQGQTGRSVSDMADSSSARWSGRRGAFESDNEEIRRHVARSAQNWANEPDVGRMAYGVPRRMDRLKGLGNAVVPQVAEYVGRLVIEHANNA